MFTKFQRGIWAVILLKIFENLCPLQKSIFAQALRKDAEAEAF